MARLRNGDAQTAATAGHLIEPDQLNMKGIQMNDSTITLANNAGVIVPFHGANLITAKVNNVVYVAMKPIFAAIGVAENRQRQKIVDEQRWEHMLLPLQTSGGVQEMLCIPLKKLNGWLFSINPAKVREDLRERVIQYQDECFEVLHDYWTKGEAVNQRYRKEQTRTALPNALTIDQQDAIKALVKSRAELQPVDKRGVATIKMWSSIKAKFGVGYKELPQEAFTDALSLVSRVKLFEGEVIEPEKDDYPVKLKPWEAFNLHGLFCHVRVMCEFFDKVYPALRQLSSPLAPNYFDNFRDGQWVSSSLSRISTECEAIYRSGTPKLLS